MANVKNKGNKFALFFIMGIIAASLLVMIIITTFFNSYDPSKYGRSNGGVDSENFGIPQEAKEQREKVGTPSTP